MAAVAPVEQRLRSLPRITLIPLAALAVLVVGALGMVGYRALDRIGAFDVHRVAVVGAPRAAGDVRAAALGAVGDRSLLTVDADAVAAAVAGLPTIRSAAADRAFPNTLRLRVVPERAVAIAPSAGGAVVLSATGRVMGPARQGRLPVVAAAPADLPGIGGTVTARGVLDQLALASAPTRGLRLAAIGYGDDGLVARTAKGVDVRIGDAHELAIKLKVARSVLRRAGGGAEYVDVTVPTAPVLRAGDPDPRTINAPVASAGALPPVGDLGAWVAGAAPAESIRTLFG